MGIFLFFAGFFLGAPALAAELSLSLKNGPQLACRKSHEDPQDSYGNRKVHWICGAENMPVLLEQDISREGFASFQAVGADEKGNSPVLVAIKTVKEGERSLFSASDYPPGMMPGDFSRPDSLGELFLGIRHGMLALAPNSDFSENNDQGRMKGTEAYEKARAAMLEEARAKIKSIEQKHKTAARYILELSNGQKVECRRGKQAAHPDPLTQQHSGCELSLCKGVRAGSKSYDALLFHTETLGGPLPQLDLIGEGELGPPLRVLRSYGEAPGRENRLYEGLSPPGFEGYAPPNSPDISPFYFQPMWDDYRATWLDRCADDEIRSLVKKEKDSYDVMARAEVKQLLEQVNGFLYSRFVRPGELPANTCQLEDGTYLKANSTSSYVDLRTRFRPLAREALTVEKARELLERVKKMQDIRFDHTEAGCEARAHVIANRLKGEGIPAEKVWLTGELHNKKKPLEMWQFHVATVVPVRGKGGKTDKMVIDPTLSPDLLTVDEWVAKIGWKGEGKPLSVAFPPPANLAFYRRPGLSFSAAEEYLPYASYKGEDLAYTLEEAKKQNKMHLGQTGQGGANAR
jgi:hypothetical protein